MYILLLSCPTQHNYVTLCHQNTEKEYQRNVVSTIATYDIHTYFLYTSDIKFAFSLKNNRHTLTTTHGVKQRQQRQRAQRVEGESVMGGESIGGRGKVLRGGGERARG